MEAPPSPSKPASAPKQTSPFFQLFFIFLTLSVLIYLIYGATRDFKGDKDVLPEILPITPTTLAQFGGFPTTVRVGLFIRDFSEFDILKNEFTFSGIVTFEFDPAVIALETLGKFSFQKGEILQISAPFTELREGLLFARYAVRVKFKTGLNHAYFPLAGYRISIVLDNYFIAPSEVVFSSSTTRFVLAPGMFVSGWKQYDKHSYTGYFEDRLDEAHTEKVVYHPRVIFAIDYVPKGLRQLVSILLPLLLVFFIVIFTFSMDPDSYFRSILTLSSGAVTALIAYKFVIENLSPKVGYFMLGDMLFFLFLTMTFVIFFFNTQTLKLSGRAKQIITIVVHAIVIAAFIYLFKYWKG